MKCDENQQFLSIIDNGIVRIKKFPPGYRFCPTEEELIVKYLMKKVKNEPLPPNLIIPEVDIYQYDPAILCENYKGMDEKAWYFFSPRERKYLTWSRAKRSTNEGYWKNYGVSNKSIYSKKRIVGKWRILTYFQGKSPTGTKTTWNMKEYSLVDLPHQRTISNTNMKLRDFVLCKIYKRVPHRRHVLKNQNKERKITYDEKLLMHQEELYQDYYNNNHLVSALMPTPQDHDDDDDYFSFLDGYPLEVLQEMASELEDLEVLRGRPILLSELRLGPCDGTLYVKVDCIITRAYVKFTQRRRRPILETVSINLVLFDY
ncbi:NAC domain-containing protein 41-like [Neltuma alba]|uniref:NAC domain-containing protein 41-like n=1 Tax=Neltuma alba TaxID=207710 RepID=UPI0010A3933B|nr:NAC domain-containing protein 41-like [Prosopis alba]